MLRIQARLAAPAALQVGRGWTVLQVHAEACNLGDDADRLVALVRPAVGPGPFSIVVELPGRGGGFTAHVQADDPVEQRGAALILGELEVVLEAAQPWEPRPPWEEMRAAGSLLRWRDELAAALRAQAPAGSLADGLEDMLHGRPLAPAAQSGLDRETLSRAVQAGGTLAQALGAADLPTAGRAAADLAGLGSGLTPAGDDFLMGAMLALWSGSASAWAQRAGQTLLDAAGPRTHRISRAWLRAAANGEAAQAWHTLIQAMLSGRATDVRRATLRIIRQGHTSGADALTGFLVLGKQTAPGTEAV